MTELEQLQEWGYTVGVAQEHEDFKVYYVEGFGMGTYVADNDADTLAALADPEAHAERVKQQDETPEETMTRLAPPEEE